MDGFNLGISSFFRFTTPRHFPYYLLMNSSDTKHAPDMPPVVLLCGGQGTRLRDVAELVPKPMVQVGPHPIVWHIMKMYAAHGVKRFILCLGYKREVFIDYFMNYHARAADVTLRLGKVNDVVYHATQDAIDWEVTLADTGDRTMTGGRVARASKYLKPEDKEFFLTYGDAVSDVDISAALAFHRKNAKALTVTAVHPAGRFGEMHLDDAGQVLGFSEKPQTEQGFINGGFMVANREILDRYLNMDSGLVFEQEPMQAIQKDGEMSAYRHHGFWQCMDNAREYQLLNDLWDNGQRPWAKGWA